MALPLKDYASASSSPSGSHHIDQQEAVAEGDHTMGNPNEGFREQDERDLELQGLLSGVRAPNKEQRTRKTPLYY